MVQASAGRGLLVEAHLALQAELAVLVVTAANGDRVVYDPVESIQVGGMCREVHAAAGHLSPYLAAEAVDLGRRVADVVGAVGVLAIELFVVDAPDGGPPEEGHGSGSTLLVNEIAPRPHNTGHHTIDGCVTSQFENHVRAVLGWPLGPVTPRADAAVTVNVVGTEGDPRDRVHLVDPAVKVHLYDKTPRPGRKIGHVTALGPDHHQVTRAARRATVILEGGVPAAGPAAGSTTEEART